MFGNKIEGEKKHRWFFKIENLDDAHDAMKAAYQMFYVLAAIQGGVVGFLVVSGNTSVGNILDPILMVFLACLIHLRQSRTAAILLIIYAILTGFITLISLLGVPHDNGFGGKNIVLSALAIYGAYKGIQGTFKFHALSKTEIIWENVFILTGMIMVYVALCFILLFIILNFIPSVDRYLYGTGGEAGVSDDVLGTLIIIPFLAVIAAGAFRVLPGTRTR